MDAEIIAAIVTALVSLAVAGIAYRQTRQNARETYGQSKELESFRAELARRERHESDARKRAELVSRFREPLVGAAYDLQSRLWNILCRDFLGTFLLRGKNDREQMYAVENTVFLIAQYFAWTEIIRREIQFIDLDKEDRTRALAQLRDQITGKWGSDRFSSNCLRIWAGEQRAIGEALIKEGPRGPECIGYGAFLALPTSAATTLLDALREDVRMIPRLPRAHLDRIVQLQHALVDLLSFLDPDNLRFPASSRTKAACIEIDDGSEKANVDPAQG